MNINESLLNAVRSGDTNAVKALLADGADVNAKGNREQTALMIAACSGQTDIVRALLNAVRADGELTAESRSASSCGELRCEYKRDDIAYTTNENVKKTLIDLRVDEDRKEARRAYVNVQDEDGRTTLMYVAWRGYSDTVKVLLMPALT